MTRPPRRNLASLTRPRHSDPGLLHCRKHPAARLKTVISWIVVPTKVFPTTFATQSAGCYRLSQVPRRPCQYCLWSRRLAKLHWLDLHPAIKFVKSKPRLVVYQSNHCHWVPHPAWGLVVKSWLNGILVSYARATEATGGNQTGLSVSVRPCHGESQCHCTTGGAEDCVREVQTRSKHWFSQLRHPSLEEGAAMRCSESNSKHSLSYDILPSTTAVSSYAIGSRKLSANEQFFVGAQTVVSLLPTTRIKLGVSFDL